LGPTSLAGEVRWEQEVHHSGRCAMYSWRLKSGGTRFEGGGGWKLDRDENRVDERRLTGKDVHPQNTMTVLQFRVPRVDGERVQLQSHRIPLAVWNVDPVEVLCSIVLVRSSSSGRRKDDEGVQRDLSRILSPGNRGIQDPAGEVVGCSWVVEPVSRGSRVRGQD